MRLGADLALTRGALDLEACFEVAAGETVALVGPNGAGKTTCLWALAGLLRVDRGRIALGERVLDSGPGGAFVPPEARGVGLVFQDHLLFAHLDARDNVAYGPRSRGVARREARARATQWLARVGLDASLHAARPAQLSGGQAQRVALARALAAEPALLLLDEPLAAVDASARLALRRELRAHLATFAGPRVLVAHDLTDALALADRLLVLEGGRLVQSGTARELVGKPRSRYVADLVGVNCLEGRAHDHHVQVGAAELTVATGLAGDVLITFHPRAVSLYSARPSGSPRNVWRAPVVAVEPLVDRARVELGGALPLVAEVTPASVAELRLAPGVEVWAAVKATELVVSER
ncbi:MAG: ABC transporter ATP-binding protein [Planctomycetes bacterium]|nr:ABC transporter ATP-binding protein [Planctomycetota bacterium]